MKEIDRAIVILIYFRLDLLKDRLLHTLPYCPLCKLS
jgi:hypothetical protein